MPREHANRSQTDNSISPYTDKIDIFNHLIKKFREEAKLLVGLKHPNIVRVWELLEANNTIYMVMDYEEGETLNSYLKKYPKLNEDEIINIMNPVFEAIKYVHSKGILHRDIAPDNIYMRKNGTPMVIDFESTLNFMAQYSQIMSSIVKKGYSPLEQYSNANQSPPTDIYALGAVLYKMMSGKRPVSSLERQNSVYSDGKDSLENLNRICKNKYSKNLIDIVNNAMNLKMKDRFQTIGEMQKALYETPHIIIADGYMFHKATNAMTWYNAMRYAKNLRLGGYDDWRLPTFDEIGYLRNSHTSKNHSNSSGFYSPIRIELRENIEPPKCCWLWTSTKHDVFNAWSLELGDGDTFWYGTLKKGCVICIRVKK
jgi:serine/threonine protein kinase